MQMYIVVMVSTRLELEAGTLQLFGLSNSLLLVFILTTKALSHTQSFLLGLVPKALNINTKLLPDSIFNCPWKQNRHHHKATGVYLALVFSRGKLAGFHALPLGYWPEPGARGS